jgi:short-subunit dehydrogenase
MCKLAVITGGTKGIGRAIIYKFAAEGFNIATCSRNASELSELKNSIESRFKDSRLHFIQADLTKRNQVADFVQFVQGLNDPAAVLVNNSGVFISGEISSEPEGNLETMMDGNLYSAYHITRGVLSGMMEKKSGHIFNMCSIASFTAYANGGSYAISKFALLGFTKCLRAELKEQGIRVTAVMPGATLTDSWKNSTLPPDRFMPSEDVANMVFASYSLSPRSVVEDIVMRPQLGDI